MSSIKKWFTRQRTSKGELGGRRRSRGYRSSQCCDLETMVSRLEFILFRSRSQSQDLKKVLTTTLEAAPQEHKWKVMDRAKLKEPCLRMGIQPIKVLFILGRAVD